jgi:hypothetical protein
MGLSKNHKVHIANQSGHEVRVIVAPNKDYVIGEIATAVATTIASAIITDGASLGAIPAEIKTFSDLMKLLKLVKTLASCGSVIYNEARLYELVDRNTIAIPNGEVKNVLAKTLLNPLDYCGPTGWARIFGGREVMVGVMTWDKASKSVGLVRDVTHFNTNSDHSWLVDGRGVHRVKYGHLWVVQPKGPQHLWA